MAQSELDALLAELDREEKVQGNKPKVVPTSTSELDSLLAQEEGMSSDPIGDFVGGAIDAAFPTEQLPSKTPTERLTNVGIAGGLGAVGGLVLPTGLEYLGQGLQKAPNPLVRVAGKGIETFGENIGKQSRTVRALEGGVGGAVGEAVGQGVTEVTGKPALGFVADVASGALVNPLFKVGTGVVGAIGTGSRALNRARDIDNPSNITNKYIERLRGTPEGDYLAAEVIGGALDRGATAIEREAADTARQTLIKNSNALTRVKNKTKEYASKVEQLQNSVKSQYLSIGKPREVSDIGDEIRSTIQPKYTKALEERSANYTRDMADRDAIVNDLESTGNYLSDFPEFRNIEGDIKQLLLLDKKAPSTTATKQVADPGVAATYNNILKAMQPAVQRVSRKDYEKALANGLETKVSKVDGEEVYYRVYPVSFKAMDDVRRKLGDVAYGKQAEGYEAIGQNIAKDLYEKFSDMQLKYVGEPQRTLQANYEEASSLLSKFKVKRGAKVTAVDRLDPNVFKGDPATLPDTFFRSKESVNDLIVLTGSQQKAEELARGYMARKLQNLDEKGIESLLTSQKVTDWVGQFPALKRDLVSFQNRVKALNTSSETLNTKLDRLAKATLELDKRKKTDPKRIIDEAADLAERVRGDVNRSAKEVGELLTRSKNPKLFSAVSKIILTNTNAKAAFPQAVRSYMASVPPSQMVKTWDVNVKPMLQSTGLVADFELNRMDAEIRNIVLKAKNQNEATSMASSMVFSMLNNAVSTAKTRSEEADEYKKRGYNTPVPQQLMEGYQDIKKIPGIFGL